MPRSPSLARDAALDRMRRLNRWLIAGAVVGTGLLTDVAAQAFTGRTITRTAGSSSTGSSRALPASPRRTRHHARHRALAPAAHAPKVVEPVAGAAAAPATQAPSTQAPATQAPVTQAPVTQAPATPAPAPVQSAPAPAPAPAPVVSGGS
jgi:hypothetical protein